MFKENKNIIFKRQKYLKKKINAQGHSKNKNDLSQLCH